MNTFNFKEVSEYHKFDNSIKNQIKELCQYNNFNGVMAVSSDYFFIAFAIYLTQVSFWLYPLSVLIIGSRQRALATVLHEAAHKTLAKNRLLNRILGTYFSGYLIFQTWDAYLRSHVFNHHTKLGSPEFDPDLKHYIESGVFERRSKNGFLMRYLVSPFFCANVFSTVRYLLVNRLALRSNGSELVPMLLTFVAFAAVGSYLVGWEFILMYWLVPYLTTFQIITWFIELAEHYPLIRGAKDNLHATRNRFSHPIEAFFTATHAENFHLTHHLFPGVPFWKLKRAHRILLEDPAYAKINAGFGGIFFSGNYACSKWEKLVFQNAGYEN